jgi:hypothetical protein
MRTTAELLGATRRYLRYSWLSSERITAVLAVLTEVYSQGYGGDAIGGFRYQNFRGQYVDAGWARITVWAPKSRRPSPERARQLKQAGFVRRTNHDWVLDTR